MTASARILLILLACGLAGLDSADAAATAATAATAPTGTNDSKTDKNAQPQKTATAPRGIKKQLFAGKVVMLREALKRRGVKSTAEFDKLVVLETPAGELIPIVPDWRGRAFYQDKRLRDRQVQLVGYRRPGVPYLQVLMVFTLDQPKTGSKTGRKTAGKTTRKKPGPQRKLVRRYFDYWCDICSIPMYEIKRCECCQGPIRMRFQSRGLPSYIAVEATDKDLEKHPDKDPGK